MKRLLPLLVLVTSILTFAGPAYACSCAMAEPEQMLEFGPTAFVGTIAGAVPAGQGPVGAQHVLTFSVETVLAGEVAAEVDVVTADNSAGCGIDANVGARMAVFAIEEGGALTSSLCSVTDADAAITALGPGTPPSQGESATADAGPFDWPVVALGAGGLGVLAVAWLLGRRRSLP
ncbi:MAG TPA: hypothetical protein VM470_03240 [Acidimicrobiia bacterium]|nr:hypothetical protein [Acidimicrobiia bacterium]